MATCAAGVGLRPVEALSVTGPDDAAAAGAALALALWSSELLFEHPVTSTAATAHAAKAGNNRLNTNISFEG
jgi:hypothetical protein